MKPMMHLHLLFLPLIPALTSAFAIPATSSPSSSPPPQQPRQPSPLPLLIWHGLGDTYSAPGLTTTAVLAARTNPGTDVYVIRLSNNTSLDRRATFFGNVSTQVSAVCDAIASHPTLSKARAVNALGFSQGGQFLRGYAQRCGGGPRVRNLVTFGSQHNGIRQFQKCGAGDWVCKSVEALLGANAWSAVAQSSLVPAQYFRDPDDLPAYLACSNYLADVNNERPAKDPRYKERVAALRRFVMYIFEKDVTVVPKESGWFAEVNATTGAVTPLRERVDFYGEDWLGLKELDAKGGLVFRSVDAEHMQLTDEVLKEAFETYFAPEEEEEEEENQGRKEGEEGGKEEEEEEEATAKTTPTPKPARPTTPSPPALTHEIQDLWIDL